MPFSNDQNSRSLLLAQEMTNEALLERIYEVSRREGIDLILCYTILGDDYYTRTGLISCLEDRSPESDEILRMMERTTIVTKNQYIKIRDAHSPVSDIPTFMKLLGEDEYRPLKSFENRKTAIINIQKNLNFGFIIVVFQGGTSHISLSGSTLSALLLYHQVVSNIKLVEINKVFFDSIQPNSLIGVGNEQSHVNIIISWVMELIKRVIHYDYGVVGIIDDNNMMFDVVNLFGFDKELDAWFRSKAQHKYQQLKRWISNSGDKPMQFINPDVFKPPIYNADVKHFLVLKLTGNEYGRTGVLILASKRFSHFELLRENKTLEHLISSLSSILKYVFSALYNPGGAAGKGYPARISRDYTSDYNGKPNRDRIFLVSNTDMVNLYSVADRIKNSRGNILITGETGVGKGFLAEYIHHSGTRKDRPFITIDCASIPDQLLESELFGHKKGSFTGAISNKIGKIEEGNKGTLFLDEIGEMNLDLQKKLLKFLDTRKIYPVGSNVPIDVDVRIIAATNKDLNIEVENNKFRKDLFHRINMFTLHIPPLRDRKDEIPLLAKHIMTRLNALYNMNIQRINDFAMQQLLNYQWPGNIRELFNIIEKSYFLHANDHSIIDIELPSVARKEEAPLDSGIMGENNTLRFSRQKQERIEIGQIEAALAKAYGNVSIAAKILGINRKTLFVKMRRYNLRKEAYKDK